MDALSTASAIYRIAGWKGLWFALNRGILDPEPRADYARQHIRELHLRENLTAAEIGVWKGRHARILQEQLDLKRLYLVDPYDAYDDYGEPKSDAGRMEEAEAIARDTLDHHDNIEWIKAYSDEAVDRITEPLDYVYIDGNHNYEYVKRDVEGYYELLKPGGILAGHDFDGSHQGVIRAVTDFAEERDVALNIEPRGSDWYVLK